MGRHDHHQCKQVSAYIHGIVHNIPSRLVVLYYSLQATYPFISSHHCVL